jgi:D-3-phosphoglycerate dehydrogenase / 2-oxoglutarate reductase
MLPVVGITYNQAFPVEDGVVRRALASLAEVRMIEMPTGDLTREEDDAAAAKMQDVVAVLFRPGSLSRRLLSNCPQLRFIAVHGAGFDKIDLQAAADLGITVTNAPGANSIGVAELTIAMAVSLVRHMMPVAAATKAGLWNEARQDGTELAGKTLGILGVGHVGSRVARRALAFDMRVVAYDPAYTPEQFAERGIRWMPIDDVCSSADVLTIHVPLDPTTVHLLNAERIRAMKPGSFLLNLARGPVIDESAVEEALRNGRLSGAALDVREDEPPGERDELRALANVIVTPHIGGSTHEALVRIAEICADEIRRFLRAEPPINVVPLPAGSRA